MGGYVGQKMGQKIGYPFWMAPYHAWQLLLAKFFDLVKLEFWHLGTFVPFWVKMADKGESMKIIKLIKTGLKLLLDILLEISSANMSPFTQKSWKKSLSYVTTFWNFPWKLKIYLINMIDKPKKLIVDPRGAKMCI